MNNGGVEGALILDFRKNDKVDVFYWTIEAMIEKVREVFLVEYKIPHDQNDLKLFSINNNRAKNKKFI